LAMPPSSYSVSCYTSERRVPPTPRRLCNGYGGLGRERQACLSSSHKASTNGDRASFVAGGCLALSGDCPNGGE